jgi:hypothetical protein
MPPGGGPSAITAGILTVGDLKKGAPEACTLLMTAILLPACLALLSFLLCRDRYLLFYNE